MTSHYCNICNFTTTNKYRFNAHLLTKKHINMQFFPEIYCEKCKNCNKKFKTKNGMMLHYYKCTMSSAVSSFSPELYLNSYQNKNMSKSLILKKEFSTIFENINKEIELYNKIK
jgi:hypothetical protein